MIRRLARWFRAAECGMDVQFGKPEDDTGTSIHVGPVYSTHAELIERNLPPSHARCPDDPRTVGQRRAEAMAAVFAGADRIACQCGSPECPTRPVLPWRAVSSFTWSPTRLLLSSRYPSPMS